MKEYTLVIGDYAKSSWSMRAWLVLKAAGVAFDTVRIRLEQSDARVNILRYSPSGKVPALIMKDCVINDSLAIAETIAENFPQAKLWPGDGLMRAKARSAAAEMHSGFVSLRTRMPFGVDTGEYADRILPDTRWEIGRMFDIWRELRAAGEATNFLCGNFGIVDAMFAPVVFRFRRFGVGVPADLQSYIDAVLNHLAVKQWLALAERELRAG